MMSLEIEDVRRAVTGQWVSTPSGGVIQDVSTDSRDIQQGDLFFALKGERHDGHDFLREAKTEGAVAAIVSEVPEGVEGEADFGLIQVEDTLEALGDLADYYRGMINASVVGITGSGGKTTTKDVTAHLLSQKFNVVKAPESYNNHVGVPLSLFKVDPVHDWVVLEIGTNKPGEINELSKIARPDVGVLTNISETHLKGLGSVEGVKEEKADLLRHLTGDGFTAYNADNRHVMDIIEELGVSGYSYGVYNKADMMASDIDSSMEGVDFTLNGEYDVRLPVPGAWNVYNVLAGLLVAEQAGVDLSTAVRSLDEFEPPSMRMQVDTVDDLTIINDAYNANPRSVQLFLDELDHYEWNGRKIVVLGDMAELGDRSEEFHRKVGKWLLRKQQIDQVYFVGDEMAYAAEEVGSSESTFSMFVSESAEEAGEQLLDHVRAGDLLLLKGSRVMQLETIIDRLQREVSETTVQQS